MALTVMLCTDGSDHSLESLRRGLAVVGAADRLVVVTAVDTVDPMLVMGTGMAGGVVSPDDAEELAHQREQTADESLERVIHELGLRGAEPVILTGEAGSAICDFAASLPASVIVLGTRGHGGLRRAVLGSVSDHVVRHAPCPVVTVHPA